MCELYAHNSNQVDSERRSHTDQPVVERDEDFVAERV